jgi:uncharacterized protein
VRLQFSGSPQINATRDQVWGRLLDPDFVAASTPGVQSVEQVDQTHFKVSSGLEVGSIKVRFGLDVELFDIVEGDALKMRVRAKAPASLVDVVSTLRIVDAAPGNVGLEWSATCEVSGPVAGVGTRLLEAPACKLTEEFWSDFARRAGKGKEEK